jgi:CRISPR system Cascade subunit CasD
MGTLLLQLIGPMQSWGVQSNFIQRDTALEPTKSGVVGLLCAALGRSRDAPIDDLSRLKMGVRVDREGFVRCDYHTAGKSYTKTRVRRQAEYLKASGEIERNDLIQSWRYYLADAAFLVGLEGDDWTLLEDLHNHLHNPIWPLYLGRKAFPPGEPVWLTDGARPCEDLMTALRGYPRLRPKRSRFDDDRMRAVLEDPEKGEIVRPDQPLSFAVDARRFAPRRLHIEYVDDQPLREDFRDVSITPFTQPS